MTARTPFQIEMGHLVEPINETDHVRGPGSATVELVEYGDYQCPFCGQAYPIVEAVLAQRPDRVRFAFRHFPLTDLHPYAEVAAEVAEAAGARDQFWTAHDWLYTHQPDIDPARLSQLARELDPSGAAAAEVEHKAHADRIRRDFIGGVRSGVNGTPTFFLNGVRHDGGYSLRALLHAVDTA